MRRLTRSLAVAGILIGPVAAAAYQGTDVLSQLGIPAASAKEAAGIVLNGGIMNPGLPAKAFKLASPAARGEMAMAGMVWLKAYAASPEFKQAYAKIRDTNKPAAPSFEGTPEEEMKKAIDEAKQQQEESRKALATLPPDQRRQVEEALKASEALVAKLDSPETRKTRLDGITAGRAARSKQYEQEMQIWNRDYPESPAPMIAKRLREFLALSADVDFTAATTTRDGRIVFENPTYEQKPGQWKMCYRAGKEATTAARAAAQAWLKELGG
jgi:hypothetical protein